MFTLSIKIFGAGREKMNQMLQKAEAEKRKTINTLTECEARNKKLL